MRTAGADGLLAALRSDSLAIYWEEEALHALAAWLAADPAARAHALPDLLAAVRVGDRACGQPIRSPPCNPAPATRTATAHARTHARMHARHARARAYTHTYA